MTNTKLRPDMPSLLITPTKLIVLFYQNSRCPAFPTRKTNPVILTHKVFIINGKCVLVRGEVNPQWFHDSTAGLLCIVEQCVPIGQQTVADTHCLSYGMQMLHWQQPRLTTSRVQVGMGAEERLIGTCLWHARGWSQNNSETKVLVFLIPFLFWHFIIAVSM